jgi:hypothetical protein
MNHKHFHNAVNRKCWSHFPPKEALPPGHISLTVTVKNWPFHDAFAEEWINDLGVYKNKGCILVRDLAIWTVRNFPKRLVRQDGELLRLGTKTRALLLITATLTRREEWMA